MQQKWPMRNLIGTDSFVYQRDQFFLAVFVITITAGSSVTVTDAVIVILLLLL